jgi:hypothetical protein
LVTVAVHATASADRREIIAAMASHGFSISDLARRHVNAAIDEAAAHGHPADSVARALLGVVVEVYRAERGADDIRRELEFVAAHLDEDEDFEFLRP